LSMVVSRMKMADKDKERIRACLIVNDVLSIADAQAKRFAMMNEVLALCSCCLRARCRCVLGRAGVGGQCCLPCALLVCTRACSPVPGAAFNAPPRNASRVAPAWCLPPVFLSLQSSFGAWCSGYLPLPRAACCPERVLA
jgi:hypothetical protein